MISLVIAAVITYFWVQGIERQMKDWPDYRGEDFLN
jgi:hypothetical protein